MKILNTIGSQFALEGKKILERVGDVSYRVLSQDELRDSVGDYEALIVGLDLRVDKEIIDAAPRLKLIATATTGLDHIDVTYAEEKKIRVLHLQSEDLKEVTGTAELAFGLLLALVRNIPQATAAVKNGGWEREKFLGRNLSGKTLGIVGLGRLGLLMARYGHAFGMRIAAYDPYLLTSNDAELVDFDALLSESDAISIHAPLTSETRALFDERAFKKMKQGAYLVNTARGAIVNEVDLISALENKTIAGYATDVLAGETEFGNDASGSRLVAYAKTHNNVVLTPHIGGYTLESRAATDILIAKKVQDILFHPL